jgi:hypothetical protein
MGYGIICLWGEIILTTGRCPVQVILRLQCNLLNGAFSAALEP